MRFSGLFLFFSFYFTSIIFFLTRSLRLYLVSTVLWAAEDGTNVFIFLLFTTDNSYMLRCCKGNLFFGMQQGCSSQHSWFSAKATFIYYVYLGIKLVYFSFEAAARREQKNAHWLFRSPVLSHV